MTRKHDLTQLTAAELGKLYARGKASPVEAMKAVLARTAKINPLLNCFLRVDEEESLAAARASEKRWKKGKPLSAIDGVPVSIKELVRVSGWAPTMGSKLTDKTPSEADAPAVARLREAGLATGRVFVPSALDQLRQELQRQYYANGKYGMKVDAEVTDLPRNRVRVDITIVEGDVARIRKERDKARAEGRAVTPPCDSPERTRRPSPRPPSARPCRPRRSTRLPSRCIPSAP